MFLTFLDTLTIMGHELNLEQLVSIHYLPIECCDWLANITR